MVVMVLRDREVEVWVKELFHIILHITGSPEVVEEEQVKVYQYLNILRQLHHKVLE